MSPGGGKRAGAGRPRILDRARTVSVILDEATDRAVRGAAKMERVSISKFIRDAVLVRAAAVCARETARAARKTRAGQGPQ